MQGSFTEIQGSFAEIRGSFALALHLVLTNVGLFFAKINCVLQDVLYFTVAEI